MFVSSGLSLTDKTRMDDVIENFTTHDGIGLDMKIAAKLKHWCFVIPLLQGIRNASSCLAQRKRLYRTSLSFELIHHRTFRKLS